MTVKFMTVKGPGSLAAEPFYMGIPQHERTMPKREDPAPVDPPVASGYMSDGMENEPIDLELADVTVTGSNLADATKVQFFYGIDGEPASSPFLERNVATKEATQVTTGVVGYTGAVAASDGFLKVVGPGGTSNAIPCGFAM